MGEMKWFHEWQPSFIMVGINFALAIANVLLKKVVDEGMNHLVIVTYRTSISVVFLSPLAYFWERYVYVFIFMFIDLVENSSIVCSSFSMSQPKITH